MRQSTVEIIEEATRFYRTECAPLNITPTIRQYFYHLAVQRLVEKSDKGYKKASRILADARVRGLFDWNWVFDATRQLHRPPTYESLEEYFELVKNAYSRNKWQSQPHLLEVWIEKDAVRGTVQSVIDRYELPLSVNRGYLSVSAKMQAVRRFRKDGRKRVVVIYIGDFDPSGVNMIHEAQNWIEEQSSSGLLLQVDRIAITEDDWNDPVVLRLSVNFNDSRSAWFTDKYGDEVVEVEALAPSVLQKRLEKAIRKHRVLTLWNQQVMEEESDAKELERRLR